MPDVDKVRPSCKGQCLEEGNSEAALGTKWCQMLQRDTGQRGFFLVRMGWPVSVHSLIKTAKLKEDVTRAYVGTEPT